MARKDFATKDKNKYSGFIGALDEEAAKVEKEEKELKEAKATKTSKTTKESKATNTSKTVKKSNTRKATKASKEQKLAPMSGKPGRKSLGYLDPNYSPEEWKINCRLPGICGRFINEMAYQHRTTIKKELERIVREEMERHPEVLEAFDELNQ